MTGIFCCIEKQIHYVLDGNSLPCHLHNTEGKMKVLIQAVLPLVFSVPMQNPG